MSEHDPEGEQPYITTRGKPPREHMFKPGQSGNPKGRPKGSKDTATLWREVMNERVEVSLSGRRRKISKRRAIAIGTVNKAMKGDAKATAQCVAMDNLDSQRGRRSEEAESWEALQAREDAMLDAFLKRQQERPGD